METETKKVAKATAPKTTLKAILSDGGIADNLNAAFALGFTIQEVHETPSGKVFIIIKEEK